MSLPSNYSSFMNMDFVEYKNANIINEEDATAAKLNGSSNDSGIASSYNSSGAGANNIQIKKEIVDEQYEKSMNPSNISAIDDNDERFSKLQLSSPIQPSSINDLDDMSAVLFDVGVDLNTTFEGLGGNDQQQQQQQANMNQVLLDSFGQNMLQEETSSNALMGRDVGLQQNMIKIEDEAAAGAAYNEETYDYDEEDDEDDEDDDDFDDEDEDDDEFDDYEDEDEYGGGGNGDDEHFAFETSEELGGGDVRLMAMRGINIGTAAGRGGGSAKASQPLMVGSVGSSLTPSLLRRNLAALPTTTTNSSSSHSRKHARIANTDADVHANMKAQHQQQSSQQQHMNRLMTSNSNNLFSNIQFQPFNSSQQQQQLPMAQNTFIQQQQQANQGNFGYLSTSLPASTSLLDSKMFVMNNNNNFIQYQQPMVPNAPFQFQAVHQAPQAPSPSSSFLSSQNNPINHPNLHKLLNNNSASNNVITLPTIHPSSKLAANVVFDASSAQNPGQLMDNVAVAAGAGAKTTKTAPRARQTKQQAAVATVQIQKAPQRKRQQKKQDLYDDDDDDENDDSNDGSELSDDENNSNEKYADSDSEANNNAYSSGRNGAGGGGGGLSSSVNSEMLFDLMMSTKNRDSYFWQYNIQSKGPKTRKVLTLRNKDPHLHREFFDPVYQLQTLNSRQGTAVNKLRKGDGNDVTPNPEKLYNLGNQIRDFIQKSYQMNSAIFQPQGHAQQLASSPSSFNLNQLSTTPNGGSSSVGDTAMVGGVRVNLKREKNKIASRACRLKKKAQHEANKLKLSGLNDEHKQLIDCISMARDLIKTRLKEPQKIPQDKKMIDLIDDLIKKNLKTKVAGHSDAYVHGLMLNVERERSKTGHGGLFDLSQPINQPQGVAGAANRFSSNLQFSGSNNTIEEL